MELRGEDALSLLHFVETMSASFSSLIHAAAARRLFES